MARGSEAKSPLRFIRGFRRILVTANGERRDVTIHEAKRQTERRIPREVVPCSFVPCWSVRFCFSPPAFCRTPPRVRPQARTTGSAVIVELFTSEGCSGCPPADAVLRQINLKQTSAGQLIVGISEHVTYWNSLGWKVPFSSPEFTERQTLCIAPVS